MRVFYVGSSGALSTTPLQWLVGSGHEICGIGIDHKQQVNRVGGTLYAVVDGVNNPLAALAHEQQIPLVDLDSSDHAAMVEQVGGLQPDLIVVSCYSRRLSDELLQQASYGGVNCHPSLLPAYRGPEPIFWQYRDGVNPLGISLHCINQDWDAGDIIASRSIGLDDGLSAAQVEREMALGFCQLLEEALNRLPQGLRPKTQDATQASYQGYPADSDFSIDATWSARRAFNFMRATEHWGRPYRYVANDVKYELKHALAWTSSVENAPLADRSDVIHIEFDPGILVASYYH